MSNLPATGASPKQTSFLVYCRPLAPIGRQWLPIWVPKRVSWSRIITFASETPTGLNGALSSRRLMPRRQGVRSVPTLPLRQRRQVGRSTTRLPVHRTDLWHRLPARLQVISASLSSRTVLDSLRTSRTAVSLFPLHPRRLPSSPSGKDLNRLRWQCHLLEWFNQPRHKPCHRPVGLCELLCKQASATRSENENPFSHNRPCAYPRSPQFLSTSSPGRSRRHSPCSRHSPVIRSSQWRGRSWRCSNLRIIIDLSTGLGCLPRPNLCRITRTSPFPCTRGLMVAHREENLCRHRAVLHTSLLVALFQRRHRLASRYRNKASEVFSLIPRKPRQPLLQPSDRSVQHSDRCPAISVNHTLRDSKARQHLPRRLPRHDLPRSVRRPTSCPC